MELRFIAIVALSLLWNSWSASGIRFVIDREDCFSHQVPYEGDTVRVSFVVIKADTPWHYGDEGVDLVGEGCISIQCPDDHKLRIHYVLVHNCNSISINFNIISFIPSMWAARSNDDCHFVTDCLPSINLLEDAAKYWWVKNNRLDCCLTSYNDGGSFKWTLKRV